MTSKQHHGNLTVQPVFLYQKLHIAKALRWPVTRTIEAKPLLSSGELSLHNSMELLFFCMDFITYDFMVIYHHVLTSTYFNLIWNKDTVCTCLHLSPSFKVTLIQDTLYQTKIAPHRLLRLDAIWTGLFLLRPWHNIAVAFARCSN